MLRSTPQYLKCFRKIGKMKNDFGTNSNNNNNNNGANGNKKKTSAKERKKQQEQEKQKLQLLEERKLNEIKIEKQRKHFVEQAKDLVNRFKSQDRLVNIWAGRPHEEMLRDLLKLFDEEPVRVLIETKNTNKSRKVGQHKSHPNDSVDKQGLVTSPLQINTTQHTFVRGGHAKTKAIAAGKQLSLVPLLPQVSIEIDIQKWLLKLNIIQKKIVTDIKSWRRKFANGYYFAVIVCFYFPSFVDLHNLDPTTSGLKGKYDNWEQLHLSLRSKLKFKRFRRKLQDDDDIAMCMKEREGFHIKVLKRIYLELVVRDIELETKFLCLPKFIEEDEEHQVEDEIETKEPSKLQIALEKIKNALSSRMRPNINAFQGQPLDPKGFQKLLKQEIRVTLIGEELQECFKYFDMDNSGSVDFKEIIHKIYHKERLSIKQIEKNKKKSYQSPKKRQINTISSKGASTLEWKGLKQSLSLDMKNEFKINFEQGDGRETLFGKVPQLTAIKMIV